MIQFTKPQADKYRRIMNRASESLSDGEAAEAPMLSAQWAVGVEYAVGIRVCYNDKLYKVLQEHTSQESWTPDASPSLFAEVLIPDPGTIPEWVQPGSTNPYMKGDKVRHNEIVWVSIVDNNVWEPGMYGWTKLE